MNTHLDFETAKLLKGKGFDKIMKYHYPNFDTQNQEICLPTNWNNFTDMSGNSNYCSVPTIAEVVMWLYEKHGIWICVGQPWENERTFQSKVITNTIIEEGFNSTDVTIIGLYNSPTEAYIEAINYCLTKLI